MSFGPSIDAKERVKQAIDIVELVGSYLQLRREGRAFKALCPWHDDTRPSLQVNPDRQSFKCWVCDIGGDVFSFIMKMEGVEFPEALAMLADRAGIDLKPARSEGPNRASDEKRILYQAAAWAEQQFHECLLRAPEADPARRYLSGRGIQEETVRRFHLGYSPDSWSWLLERARSTPFTPRILHMLGLVGQRQGGNGYYDRFKGRVLFSIRDTQGRPVAVGGRVLPELATAETAKYINSPESPLYSKSNTLYALDVARDAITKAKPRHAMVMEGYTDVLIAQQCGFGDAVAVCGTALGQRHIHLLRRYADVITLVLDGDEAGQRRTNEILELFVAEQVDLRILTLPEALDPCDFLLEHGEAAFRELLSGAVDALEHKIRVATRDVARGTHRANQALEEILATLAKAPRLQDATETAARLREHQVLARLAREFRVAEEELRVRLTALRRSTKKTSESRVPVAAAVAPAAPDLWERELIENLLEHPESVTEVAEVVQPADVDSTGCRRILTKCYELSLAGVTPDFPRLLLEFDEPDMKNLLVTLDEERRAKGGHDLRGILDSFRRRHDERHRSVRTAALSERRLEEREEDALLQQLIDHERSRRGISAPTDG